VVSVTDAYGRILGFLDRKLKIQVDIFRKFFRVPLAGVLHKHNQQLGPFYSFVVVRLKGKAPLEVKARNLHPSNTRGNVDKQVFY
jgi:hypothetical protein